eukprot:CAMPEP_0177701258 /NCGR_PEP_ID=MMETSP0484_2-20121128/6520_1 /TAXON_ID=354590 /ORGANISM="Rhodomonas lens, Strain RHODO" /LENGTH=160 /DNA_ID=CAMNT_0019212489 /DNA_START=42 /DNA_END=521 /DNA_ORIENTATION=+
MATHSIIFITLIVLFQACCCNGSHLPFGAMGLPKSVSQYEHQLGVNDNQLPGQGQGQKKTNHRPRFALSSYDQKILAQGPPPAPPPSAAPSAPTSQSSAYVYPYPRGRGSYSPSTAPTASSSVARPAPASPPSPPRRAAFSPSFKSLSSSSSPSSSSSFP